MIVELQGLKRRTIYVFLYEAIAITLTSTAITLSSDNTVGQATLLSFISSAFAITWNFIFNYIFEFWEIRQSNRTRTVKRRVIHAIGFQTGLLAFFVPFFAWWFQISYFQAFILDMGFLIFYFFYSFCFNWVFDISFGLPNSAKEREIEEHNAHLF